MCRRTHYMSFGLRDIQGPGIPYDANSNTICVRARYLLTQTVVLGYRHSILTPPDTGRLGNTYAYRMTRNGGFSQVRPLCRAPTAGTMSDTPIIPVFFGRIELDSATSMFLVTTSRTV